MEQIIADGLAQLDLTDRIPPDAAQKLAEYGRLLLEKNQMMNLTAIREPEGVARLHMLDCAALLDCADWSGPQRLLDVGTGAGFPGLVLKILLPQLEVHLLDGLAKRLNWLETVARELQLEQVTTLHGRAEEFSLRSGWRDSYDKVTARAVADLRLLAELCLPYVKVGGLFLAMKSTGSDEEIDCAAHAVKLLGGRVRSVTDYTIPGSGVSHRVVAIEKVAPTLKGYPRRWAKIQKEPL